MSESPAWDQVEQLHPIKAPKLLGERVHTNTLRRWASKGLYSRRTGRNVVLETVYKGQMLYTSKERVLAFYRKLNGIKT
jgi:hypothetical protein